MNRMGLFDSFWRDLRYALRVLGKNPGFALTAVLSLALGSGANSAVFSIIQAVLIRPLPYLEADRLVRVGRQGDYNDISVPHYEFWKEHTSSFSSAAGYRGAGDQTLAVGANQRWISVMTVTTDFFRTLGVAPALGREFNSEETRQGGPQAIILSSSVWRNTFAADPHVLGRVVRLDDTSRVVIGVLPRGFWFPDAADVFVPLQPSGTASDLGANTGMIARLKPGISLSRAQAEMPALTEAFRQVRPDSSKNESYGLALTPLHHWLDGNVRLNLLLLFGAVTLLLLIACFNLASLLLSRLVARRKEIAVRLALGSSRGNMLRQFLVENLVITLAGGLAGVLGARVLLDAIVALIPFDLPAAAPIRVDTAVLGFALAVVCATGLAFSLLPILTASHLDVQEALKSGGRSGGNSSRQPARSILIVVQVGLSVTLLISAALLTQSLYRLHHEQLGFHPDGITTFNTPIAAERRRNQADLRRFESTMMEQLQSLPGVRSVAAVSVLPLAGFNNFPAQRGDHPENSIGGMEIRAVTPGYFEVMGIPIRRGRRFLDNDTDSSPPVILVNETLARRWWPNGNPIGDRIVVGRFRGEDYGTPTSREVVGLVADTKTSVLKEPPRPTVYVPAAQMTEAMTDPAWVLRAKFSTGLENELRRTIAAVDPHQRLGTIRTMDDVVAATTASSRFDAWLFAGLAGLALTLTIVGIYGLLSSSVAQRTNEIGTRMALGASRPAVLILILKQGIGLVAAGLVLGLAGAFAVTRLLASLLFGVHPNDPASFAGVSALLLFTGLAASYLPARRATKVDPVVALREE